MRHALCLNPLFTKSTMKVPTRPRAIPDQQCYARCSSVCVSLVSTEAGVVEKIPNDVVCSGAQDPVSQTIGWGLTTVAPWSAPNAHVG